MNDNMNAQIPTDVKTDTAVVLDLAGLELALNAPRGADATDIVTLDGGGGISFMRGHIAGGNPDPGVSLRKRRAWYGE